jgi:LPS sulfotransferase NodH
MWGYFRGFIHRLRDLRPDDGYTGRALLGAEFPQLHYVWMSRRDKVRQAVSLWKALQTKAWHRKEGEPELRPGDLVFSFEAIDHLVAQLEEHDRGWEDFFVSNGILPHRVAYEDLVDSYEDTAIDIVRFLGVEVPDRVDFGERRMKQQADGFNEEWVGLYWETASPRQRVAES